MAPKLRSWRGRFSRTTALMRENDRLSNGDHGSELHLNFPLPSTFQRLIWGRKKTVRFRDEPPRKLPCRGSCQ